MKLWKPQPRLPLLVKELTEQAARKRTYVVRVVYAVGLFLIFCGFAAGELRRAQGSPMGMLGAGRGMFEMIVVLQFFGIYIFLPAIMSSVLTYEKERDSLALLFLTDLRPWEILLQKYLGRLIPMVMFLMLSMPLMALAYAIGGVTTNYVAGGVFLLLLTCLQVGAFALMASSWCRTTVGAFLGAYLGLAGFYFLPLLTAVMSKAFGLGLEWREEVVFAFLPVYIYDRVGQDSFDAILLRSLPILASTVVFLLLARAFLFTRAFVPVRSLTLQVFKRLDRFWNELNKGFGGIVLIRDKTTMPDDEPVHWRETTKKSLGKFAYLFRLLVMIETPILFIAVAMSMMGGPGGLRGSEDGLALMVAFLWVIAALFVCVWSADGIPSERASQTLEVLLATPLTAREIVRQKMKAVWRLILVLWVPLLSVILMKAMFAGEQWPYSDTDHGLWTYLIPSVLALVIYLPMFAWVSFWIGMKTRSRPRAIILALVVLVLWCALPPLAVAIIVQAAPAGYMGLGQLDMLRRIEPLLLFSPAGMIATTETTSDMHRDLHLGGVMPIVLNFAWYAAVLLYFRHLCLARAERYLRGKRVSARTEMLQHAVLADDELGSP